MSSKQKKSGKSNSGKGNTNMVVRYLTLEKGSYTVHEWIALALLLVMAVQPLQCITKQAFTTNQVISLFAARRDLIRALGYGLLLNGLVFYIRRLVTEGAGILRETFLKRPWNSFLLLLLLWSFICVGHAPDKEIAVAGDPVRFEGILSYIAYAGFFVGASMIKRDYMRRILYITAGVAATVLGVMSMICYYYPSSIFLSYMDAGTIGGLSGTFVNTNHYGYYLCIMAVLLFGLALMTEEKLMKLLFALMGVFQCVVLFVNNTMGSILAALLGTAVLLVLTAIRKGGRVKRFTLAGLGVLLACAVGFTVLCVQAPQSSELTTDVANMITDVENIMAGEEAAAHAGSGRWGIWRASVRTIKAHPLMGCGTDNAYYTITPELGFNKMPHNEFLQMAQNMGLPALGLYLAALMSICIDRMRRLRALSDTTVVAGCVAVTYLASSFFGVSLCTMLPFLYMFLALCAGDTAAAEPAQA